MGEFITDRAEFVHDRNSQMTATDETVQNGQTETPPNSRPYIIADNPLTNRSFSDTFRFAKHGFRMWIYS